MKKNNIMIKKIINLTIYIFSGAFSLTINVPEDFLDIQDAIDFDFSDLVKQQSATNNY